MMRLATAIAGVGLVLALAPPVVSPAASNNATNLFPLDGEPAGDLRPARLPWSDRQL